MGKTVWEIPYENDTGCFSMGTCYGDGPCHVDGMSKLGVWKWGSTHFQNPGGICSFVSAHEPMLSNKKVVSVSNTGFLHIHIYIYTYIHILTFFRRLHIEAITLRQLAQ